MSDFRRMLSPIVSRIQAMIGRAILSAVSDAGGMQVVKVSGLSGEVIDKLDHPQPFGFTANCPTGGQAVVAFVGGSRDQGIVLVVDHTAHRKKNLKAGESAVYSSQGTYVYLKEDGTIEIETNGSEVKILGRTVSTETIHSDKDVEAAGDVSDSVGKLDKVRDDLASLKLAYDAHVHSCSAPGLISGPAIAP